MHSVRIFAIALCASFLSLVALSPLSCSLLSDKDRESLDRMESGLSSLTSELKDLNTNLSSLDSTIPDNLGSDINGITDAMTSLEDRMALMSVEMFSLSKALENIPEGLTAEELEEFMDNYLDQLQTLNDQMGRVEELVEKLEEMNGHLEGNQEAVENLTTLLESAMGDYNPYGEEDD